MPATPRHRRRQRNEYKSWPSACKKLEYEIRRLTDGSTVHVTASGTGIGTHWRWIYTETDEAEAPVTSAPSSLSTKGAGQYPQSSRFITPVPSIQQIPPSILNAPRRREKRHPKPAGAPTPARQPVVPENTIPWEKDLEAQKHGPSGARPERRALGPHGTWLVDEGGNCIIIPEEEGQKRPQVDCVKASGKKSG
ncbi:hypothetical protein AX15_007509 [Amanita polypyramis BW_CC]|nr:hypothetical protein AX15_007509 [Amanita polypyramis BW_CC]